MYTNDGRVVPASVESVQDEVLRQANRFKTYGDSAKLRDDDAASMAHFLASSAFVTIWEMLEELKKVPPFGDGTGTHKIIKRPEL